MPSLTAPLLSSGHDKNMRPAGQLSTHAGRPACCSLEGSDHLLPFIKFSDCLLSMILVAVREDFAVERDMRPSHDIGHGTLAVVEQGDEHIGIDSAADD